MTEPRVTQPEHDSSSLPKTSIPQNDSLFVFVGGGTGGHLVPGLAVAEALIRLVPHSTIMFLHTGREVEKTILASVDHEIQLIPLVRTRDILRHPFRFVSAFWKATRTCQKIVRHRKPTAIIGLGGVASVPMIRVAKKTPVVLLEQNVLPGRTTRWLAMRHPVLMSFEQTRDLLPNPDAHVLTGNPVSRTLCDLSVNTVQDSDETTLLVLGGSQGSRQVNDAVIASVKQLGAAMKRVVIVHQTGSGDCDRVREAYEQMGIQHEVQEFFGDMHNLYQRATIAVARSGATTLAELAIAGIPSIFIPYPQAKDDHQTVNARQFVEAGAAVMVDSHDTANVASQLQQHLSELLNDAALRESMRTQLQTLAMPNAADNVAQEIIRRANIDRLS
jgi:UDP-N-acetylglucosamine--N-acetylmuramyl-(pentapeptide) pyrophosphoryl-undecaprenol N-acetylglucosamine transferase